MPPDNNLDPFGLRRAAEAARRGPTHNKFLFMFIGAGIVMSFLVLASLAPQIGERLGNLSVQKSAQESHAAGIDTDGDGFSDEIERWVDTSVTIPCPRDVNDFAWPPDINNDRLVNLTDVLRFNPSF